MFNFIANKLNPTDIYQCSWYGWRPLHGIYFGLSIVAMIGALGLLIFDPSYAVLFVLGGLLLAFIWSGLAVLLQRRVRAIWRSRQYRLDLSTWPSAIKQSTPYDKEFAQRLISQQYIHAAANWSVYDVSFEIYHHPKYRKYKPADEAYYTVFEARFEAEFPHILLDSKLGKSTQFQFTYAGNQRLAISPELDRHFQAYTPAYYDLDAISILTSGLTDELFALRKYDLEFVNRSLFIYAPLMPVTDLNHFMACGQALSLGFQRRLEYYKDSFRKRQTGVTEFGRTLLNNPSKYLWGGLVLISLSVLALVLAGTDLMVEGLLFGLFGFCGLGYFFIVKSHNEQALTKFKQGILDSPRPASTNEVSSVTSGLSPTTSPPPEVTSPTPPHQWPPNAEPPVGQSGG